MLASTSAVAAKRPRRNILNLSRARSSPTISSIVLTCEIASFGSFDQISPRLLEATIAVEDSRFFDHCGVDRWAVVRALAQNVAHLRTVSGASTLTMQVCRMMDDRPRTWRAKLVEAFRAVQLERTRSKSQILQIYVNIAPYGGNVRGVEAASPARKEVARAE